MGEDADMGSSSLESPPFGMGYPAVIGARFQTGIGIGRCSLACQTWGRCVRVCTAVHPVGPSQESAYDIRITWMEYHVLRQTGLPLEDLSNVSNMFTNSLLNLLAHGSSYCHNNYLSI